MQKLAESFQVVLHTEEGDQQCALVLPCVQFFTDADFPPEIGEGSTWIWEYGGLPQVIAQVYQWKQGLVRFNWRVGVYNLSRHRIRFDDGASIQRNSWC